MSDASGGANLGEVFGGDASGATFLGLPACTLDALPGADVVIFGAPLATPYPGFGSFAAAGPAAIRAAMAYYAPIAGHHDFDLDGSLLEDRFGSILDAGDLAGSADDAAGNRAAIEAAVAAVLEAGAAPLVLGGDDSVPIPVFQAFAGRGPYTLLQFDAHLDFRDEVGGERLGLSSNMRRAAEMDWVRGIVQVGMRSAGSARRAELEAARASGNLIVTAREVYRQGIDALIDAIPVDLPLLVNIDCDVLDSSVMPAVMSPTPGGLSYWDVVDTLTRVAARTRIDGLCITEFMPARDPGGTAALTVARIAANAAALMAAARAG